MPTVTQFRLGTDVSNLLMGDDPGVFYSVGEATTPPLLTAFPTADTVGVDAIPGWTPDTTITPGEVYFINTEGALFEDTRFVDCFIVIQQPHVTFRRCEIVGGAMLNYEGGSTLANDVLFEDSTIRYTPAGHSPLGPGPTAFGCIAGSTLRRSALIDVNEGVRTGGSGGGTISLLDPDVPNAWDVNIIDSYIRLHGPTPYDAGVDWHGDCWEPGDTGLPGGGVRTVIRNSVFWCDDDPPLVASSCMTTGFGHMLPFDINGLILSGGGYSFYNRSGGDYRNMYFNDGSWTFGPIVTDDPLGWSRVTTWENVKVCTIDGAGQPDTIIGSIPLGWEGGAYDPP
jgi:hypothetical protein